MNWPTVIVLLVVLGLVVIAIKAMRSGKDSCSCGGKGKTNGNCNGCQGCTVDCPFRR